MSRRRPWNRVLAAVTLAGTLVASIVPAVAAETDTPAVRLIPTKERIVAYRYDEGGPVFADPGVIVSANGGAFEVRAFRRSYRNPIEAVQFLHGSDTTTVRQLPEWVAPTFDGLADFIRVVVKDLDGNVVHSSTRPFCPEGQDMRTGPSGPSQPTYPRLCPRGPFTLGGVWGIDRGWGVSLFGWDGLQFDLENGAYDLRISVTKRYLELFDLDRATTTAKMRLRVRTEDHGCPLPAAGATDPSDECIRGDRHARHGDDHARHGDGHAPSRGPLRGPLGVAPSDVDPSDDTMPDLVALPAWGIQLVHRNRRDFIEFGATVWNAGPAPLLVEGYRRSGTDVMDAYQYFMDGTDPVGRAKVGTMRFHRGGGHDHWHFLQFARYSLLDADREEIGLSRKQAFCLAPTDAIDLTIPGAEWHPGETGLGTACGGEEAIWVRETLQAGWGDTYFQVAGQSIEVTNVPNGTYYMAVEANPTGLLYERSSANNVRLRKIILGGTPGERTIEVKPWNGIDA